MEIDPGAKPRHSGWRMLSVWEYLTSLKRAGGAGWGGMLQSSDSTTAVKGGTILMILIF